MQKTDEKKIKCKNALFTIYDYTSLPDFSWVTHKVKYAIYQEEIILGKSVISGYLELYNPMWLTCLRKLNVAGFSEAIFFNRTLPQKETIDVVINSDLIKPGTLPIIFGVPSTQKKNKVPIAPVVPLSLRYPKSYIQDYFVDD